MNCYRIRKKTEFLNEYDIASMKKRGEINCFVSPLYDTLRGAKSALNNSNGYLSDYKHMFEIVEYALIEKQIF